MFDKSSLSVMSRAKKRLVPYNCIQLPIGCASAGHTEKAVPQCYGITIHPNSLDTLILKLVQKVGTFPEQSHRSVGALS